MITGNLVIRPLETQLTHSTEFIGKMSPYLKCVLGNESKETESAKRMHLTPVWDTELVFRYRGETNLRVEVWNKEVLTKDNLIGYGTLDLGQTINQNTFSSDVPLYYQDKDAGFIRLSLNFYPDGSNYDPFTASTAAKQRTSGLGAQSLNQPSTMGTVGSTQGSMQNLKYETVGSTAGFAMAGGTTSTGLGTTTGLPETTFLPSQAYKSSYGPSQPMTQQTQTITINNPIVHKETQRIFDEPVYYQQKPIIHEKRIIIEKPIITEKIIYEETRPIIRERTEFHETPHYEKSDTVTVRQTPKVIKEDLDRNFNFDRLTLEGEPISSHQTEYRRLPAEYRKEESEVYQKEIVHDRRIIHEKDVYFVEKNVIVEKPEIRERPILRTEEATLSSEPLIKKELLAEDLELPQQARVHSERVVVTEAPVYIRERPEVFEKEIITERQIIHEQPIVFTERPEIIEKPEYIERRSHKIDQPVLEQEEPEIPEELGEAGLKYDVASEQRRRKQREAHVQSEQKEFADVA